MQAEIVENPNFNEISPVNPERRVNYHEPIEIGTKTKLLIAAGALLTAAAIGNVWHRVFGDKNGGQA